MTTFNKFVDSLNSQNDLGEFRLALETRFAPALSERVQEALWTICTEEEGSCFAGIFDLYQDLAAAIPGAQG
jgi:hypothetical protein